MRTLVIAMAAIAVSATSANAQFETFFGSNGFAGFDGSTATAGCLSGASGTAMTGMGMTTCNANAGGDYQFQSFSGQSGTFDGDIAGGFSNSSGSAFGIESTWISDGGPKTGGNTISGGVSNNSGSGVQFTGSTWGSFEQFTNSTFNGWSNVNTTSNFTLGGGGVGGGD